MDRNKFCDFEILIQRLSSYILLWQNLAGLDIAAHFFWSSEEVWHDLWLEPINLTSQTYLTGDNNQAVSYAYI